MYQPFRRDPREVIRELMRTRGIPSVRQLALLADVPQPTVHRYLKGEHDAMELDKLVALASVLDVTLSEMLGETPIIDAKVRDVLEAVYALPAEGRDVVIATARSLRQALPAASGGRPPALPAPPEPTEDTERIA